MMFVEESEHCVTDLEARNFMPVPLQCPSNEPKWLVNAIAASVCLTDFDVKPRKSLS